jgi:cadmium resistance protein CadD (predicted permease)
MRFIILFVYVFVILTVFLTWSVVSNFKEALQEFPSGLVTIIALVLGIPTYFKKEEKKEETKQNGSITSNLDGR